LRHFKQQGKKERKKEREKERHEQTNRHRNMQLHSIILLFLLSKKVCVFAQCLIKTGAASATLSNREYLYSLLDQTLVHCRAIPRRASPPSVKAIANCLQLPRDAPITFSEAVFRNNLFSGKKVKKTT